MISERKHTSFPRRACRRIIATHYLSRPIYDAAPIMQARPRPPFPAIIAATQPERMLPIRAARRAALIIRFVSREQAAGAARATESC